MSASLMRASQWLYERAVPAAARSIAALAAAGSPLDGARIKMELHKCVASRPDPSRAHTHTHTPPQHRPLHPAPRGGARIPHRRNRRIRHVCGGGGGARDGAPRRLHTAAWYSPPGARRRRATPAHRRCRWPRPIRAAKHVCPPPAGAGTRRFCPALPRHRVLRSSSRWRRCRRWRRRAQRIRARRTSQAAVPPGAHVHCGAGAGGLGGEFRCPGRVPRRPALRRSPPRDGPR